ncbi:MAG: hypothetical protein INH41_31320 [Myxococcaceae bacterium]|jgi:hypothetical protein|nr:hypothetical protein [Myxococcaceae bacterium]MCA3016898.1 hypothetical protein [Myxococcaceae bacterium]
MVNLVDFSARSTVSSRPSPTGSGGLSTTRTALDELPRALLAHLELAERKLCPELMARARTSARRSGALVAQSFSDTRLRLSAGLRAFPDRHVEPRDLAGRSRD